MGVDEQIARFFVDRKVPENNVFWKGRLLYVSGGNGFTSIPVYYDLLHRLGLPREILLSETHLHFMEWVMHYAILAEQNQISFTGQLESITHLLEGRVQEPSFFQQLLEYLHQSVLKPIGRLGKSVPALNRADVFLFILCDLPLSEDQLALAIRYWYGLHTSYLLMDDIYDYQFDKQDKEDSSILELGDGPAAFEKAFQILQENQAILSEINPILGQYFAEKLVDLKDLIPK